MGVRHLVIPYLFFHLYHLRDTGKAVERYRPGLLASSGQRALHFPQFPSSRLTSGYLAWALHDLMVVTISDNNKVPSSQGGRRGEERCPVGYNKSCGPFLRVLKHLDQLC